MKRVFIITTVLTFTAWHSSPADESAALKAPIPATAKLFIGPSSAPIPTGSAGLTISPLNRGADAYSGGYQIKVSPYFFKSETGKISIVVSEESLRKLSQGIAVDITGEAITDGTRKTRPLTARATPAANNRGSVTFSFTASDRKMVFNSSYRFGEK